ncbi:hypothetical protein [Streptomyces prunicolor]|uniref:hypothetical protein n=1 Tax=Streptomyces prunicolor TaxID=67348 RepID=UPI00035DF78D|nr:hypothetical protein [Streptomyces prunicolor]
MTAGQWDPDRWTPRERLAAIVAQEINDAPAEELIKAATDDVLRAWAAKIRTVGGAKGWSTWSADYIHPDVEFIDIGLPALDEIDLGPGDEKDTSGGSQPNAGESTPDELGARIAELQALVDSLTELRLWEPGYGLYVRRPSGGRQFAVVEANSYAVRGRRAWTPDGWRFSALLSDSELYCWPDAETATAQARRLMPSQRADEQAGC